MGDLARRRGAGGGRGATLLVILILLSGGVAAAQMPAPSLKVPTTLFAVAASADWATTHRILSTVPGAREANPMLGITHSHPTRTVLLGAALDVAGVWATHRFVAKKHPKWAKVGLYAATAFRLALVARNMRMLATRPR